MSQLQLLIDDIAAICAQNAGAVRAHAVRRRLAQSLEVRDWLPQEVQKADPAHYCPRLLHAGAGGSFSLVAMTWLPGQRTPIHDHISWCVVGIYQGVQRSTGYNLVRDPQEVLVPKDSALWNPGDTDVLIPPDEDIHQVTCEGDGKSVSLHVYGADISVHGSSINRCFDSLPVRMSAAVPVSWRNGE